MGLVARRIRNGCLRFEGHALEDPNFKSLFKQVPAVTIGEQYFPAGAFYNPEYETYDEHYHEYSIHIPADYRTLRFNDYYGDLAYGYPPAKDGNELQEQLNKIQMAHIGNPKKLLCSTGVHKKYGLYLFSNAGQLQQSIVRSFAR